MDNIEDRKFGDLDALNAQNDFTFSVWRVRCRKMIERLFQPSSDLHDLNVHLRRDAGIDENELEWEAVRRAPLIR